MSGEIVAGRLVRLACERHLRDWADRNGVDLAWDLQAALRAINFFRDVLRLNGGDHEGQPFVLQPWQAFIVGALFGWKGLDGYRRFRVAYVEVAKGNGKSPLAAGIALYMLLADKEPRAEVYSAAVDREQARILFRDAVAMVDQSPELDARLTRSGGPQKEWNLAHLESGSFFRPIASESQGRGKSGPRPHAALIDELHEHPTSAMVEFMRAGTKGRTQALIFEITNAGFDRESICWHHHAYGVQILEQALDDDSRFVFIASLDPCETCRKAGKEFPSEECGDCDDWRDEAVWPKANPNLGISVTEKYLREQVHEATGMPSKQNLVKRLCFTIWTEQDERWIPVDEWLACKSAEPITLDSLRGRRCFAGLDLATTSDLAALVLVFPPRDEAEPTLVKPFFWVPASSVSGRVKSGVSYDVWIRGEWMFQTEGDVTDYREIRRFILRLRDEHGIHMAEIAYDPDDATQLATELQEEGFTPVPFYQSKRNFTPAIREAETLIRRRALAHDGSPPMTWNIANMALESNAQGQVKPSKARAREKKNDGAVAYLMGQARAILQPVSESADQAMGYLL